MSEMNTVKSNAIETMMGNYDAYKMLVELKEAAERNEKRMIAFDNRWQSDAINPNKARALKKRLDDRAMAVLHSYGYKYSPKTEAADILKKIKIGLHYYMRNVGCGYGVSYRDTPNQFYENCMDVLTTALPSGPAWQQTVDKYNLRYQPMKPTNQLALY